MAMSREQKREEAIKRLQALGVMKNVVNDFKEGVVNVSENGGFLYWVNDEQKKIIQEFEEKNNAVVYHIIHGQTNIGELLNILYVSDWHEEWEMDRDDLRNGQALAYVKNLTMPDCSEFGSIGVAESIGGLVRTW